ncbi:protein SHORTAGE IN CHIASMATA 1 isoform X2 [Henckelia pumila]|uniref:protein SHORTAGE IN CHIASMATA 1 isoform X2 n=1 Tax=Henckelia pumila TaxID=405737 RepID=UPI003C6E5EC4
MRTRFLATEHSAAAAQPIDYVPLPPPHIPPPDIPSFSADFVHSFDDVAGFTVSKEIDKLPIDDALSIFLSDVLPHFVDGADCEERGIASSKENFEVKHEKTSNIKGWIGTKFVQFEVSEMDASPVSSPKSAIDSQMETLCAFLEISDAECTMDLCHTELRLPDHQKIQQSVYSVDDMKVEYPMEHNADFLQNADSIQGQNASHDVKFPLFEVDVGSLCTVDRIYMEDALLIFENVETRQLTELDGVNGDRKELLGSMEFDLMKYALNQCVSIQYLEETKCSPEVDHLSILEHPNFHEYSTFHQGKPDDSVCSMNPFLFNEFQFFDLVAYNFFETSSHATKEIEAETCESMFGEAMNFRSFNEMIVCHELTLMDDSFKSLPVPMPSDCKLTYSLSSFIEEILLTQLEWQSSSTSDGLYLDWHFLGEHGCEFVEHSSCWKMLWEIDTYSIDSSIDSSDNGKPIFNYILSEIQSNEQSTENHNEILNLHFSGVSIFHNSPASSGKLDSNSLMNPGDQRITSGVEKVPLFGASMSNDLDFFLNPLNFNIPRVGMHEDKSTNTNTMCQVVSSIDDSLASKAATLVQEQWNVKLHHKGDLESTSAEEERKTKLEEMLNTVPETTIDENQPVKAVYEDKSCSVMLVPSMQPGLESKQNDSCRPSCPDTVIIVNTQNFNDEMVISRRSTYQKILEMEKEGAQVVERDISLPIDIIASAKVCLTWYDCKNIGKKASAPNEAFSCLPLCVESIAASTLTSLSFAFGCCILIFEGEGNFLGGIMESSDELYAAAASLGIDVQIFCSYSSEMTEEIILSCINKISKLNRGLFPKMSESESIAESFLTAFPSINPLSAHAILSSDTVLGKFMEFSNESKRCSLQKYQVPEESLSLLSAISRFGEREDSKSGLTDCSSVSSVLDSENVHFKSASERKKPKYSPKHLYPAEEPTNCSFHLESLKLLPDEHNHPKFYVSSNSWMSGTAEMFDEPGNFNISFDDEFRSYSERFAVDTIKMPTNMPKPYDFPASKSLPQVDIDCGPDWRSATTELNGFSLQSTKGIGNSQENFKGEVINAEGTPEFGDDLLFANLGSFSPFLLDVEKDYAARNSRRSKLSSSANIIDVVRNPIHAYSAFDAWIPGKDGQIIGEETKPHFDTINSDNTSMAHRKGHLKVNMIEETPKTLCTRPSQENHTNSYGGTPLSNALHSTQLQQGSPWTIDFLNRIREKSRLRKQSLSYNSSPPCFGSSGNISNNAKRKSPSIFESYKYEVGSTSKKIGEQKRQKRSSKPPNSMKNENTSTSRPPSWTPLDKRARRVLSFATKGSGGQSKLVWKDNNSHTAKRIF